MFQRANDVIKITCLSKVRTANEGKDLLRVFLFTLLYQSDLVKSVVFFILFYITID